MQPLTTRGFTLIELLVVIAIIGTLASVVLASLNQARAKARDAQRVSAIRELEKALQVYWLDNDGTYPPSDTGTQVITSLTELVPNYIPSLPVDPQLRNNNPVYGYRYHAPNPYDGYTMLVWLETDSNSSWCTLSGGTGSPTWYGVWTELSHADCQ